MKGNALARLRGFSRRERTAAALAAAIVLSALAYVHVLEPFALAWLDVHARAVEAADELERLRSLVEHREEIEREFDLMQGAVAAHREHEDMHVALLSEVHALATRRGMHVFSLKPLKRREEGQFYRYAVELQGACKPHEAGELLHAMQDARHLLRTDLLTLTVQQSESPVWATLRASKLVRKDN